MKIICRTLGLAVLALIASGCAATMSASDAYWSRTFDRARYQDTATGITAADRLHIIRQVVDQDSQALVDDFDYIFFLDRPSRLGRWHER